MFLKSLIAAGVLSAGIAGAAVTADAKTNIYLGIGVPGPVYDTPYYDDYPPPPPPRRARPRHYEPEPVYDEGYYAPPRPAYRVSCGDAARMLRHNGYRRIEPQDCGGRRYSFIAWRRGFPYVVSVSARSGRIIARSPL